MRELKPFNSERIYWAVEQVEREAGDIDDLHLDDNLFYLKSEVDMVINELKVKLRVQTSNAEDAWKLKDSYHSNYAEAVKELYEKNKELRHHKYKRCLAMEKWCSERVARIEKDYAFWRHGKDYASNFYKRWKKRWLELAEKFKPNNSTAQ